MVALKWNETNEDDNGNDDIKYVVQKGIVPQI